MLQELNIAINTARLAGKYLLDNFRKDKELVSMRGLSKEIITKYDLESDKIIIKELQKHYPDHNMLTEESGEIKGNSDFTWIVDSMDGSGNFASGNPFFSVSIALVKNSRVILGVVYAPFLDELYYAEIGKGAYLNENRIFVTHRNELSSAYIVTCEGGSKSNEKMAMVYSKVYPIVKDMRKIGSAAIECGYVASGRAEGYITLNISPWDVAAGILIVSEAGGCATDFRGKPWEIKNTDLVVSNGSIHDDILKLVK